MDHEEEWMVWNRAVASFHKRCRNDFVALVERAPPRGDGRLGVADMEHATAAFLRVIQEYTDGLEAFMSGHTTRIATGKRLRRLGDVMDQAFEDYHRAADMDPTDRRIEIVSRLRNDRPKQ